MIKVDFPFSALLIIFDWRYDYPLLWFGVFGTLWWYLLSREAEVILDRFLRKRHPKPI